MEAQATIKKLEGEVSAGKAQVLEIAPLQAMIKDLESQVAVAKGQTASLQAAIAAHAAKKVRRCNDYGGYPNAVTGCNSTFNQDGFGP